MEVQSNHQCVPAQHVHCKFGLSNTGLRVIQSWICSILILIPAFLTAAGAIIKMRMIIVKTRRSSSSSVSSSLSSSSSASSPSWSPLWKQGIPTLHSSQHLSCPRHSCLATWPSWLGYLEILDIFDFWDLNFYFFIRLSIFSTPEYESPSPEDQFWPGTAGGQIRMYMTPNVHLKFSNVLFFWISWSSRISRYPRNFQMSGIGPRFYMKSYERHIKSYTNHIKSIKILEFIIKIIVIRNFNNNL